MAKATWTTYQCLSCHAIHEMRGSPAQLARQGATKCPDCKQPMVYKGQSS